MGQVTIYLEDEIERKMIAAAHSSQLSKSKWIAKLIQDKVSDEWPRSLVDLAGAWGNFPESDELRASIGEDAKREQL